MHTRRGSKEANRGRSIGFWRHLSEQHPPWGSNSDYRWYYAGTIHCNRSRAVALFYTLLIGFVFYDSPSLKEFLQVSYEGFVTTAALLFIITAAFLYSFMVRRAQIPHVLSDFVTGITTNPLPTLLLLVAILLIIGLMMETIAAITILVPVLLPIIHSAGIDPIHFGIIMILTLMIGLLTPPFGIILFILQRLQESHYPKLCVVFYHFISH